MQIFQYLCELDQKDLEDLYQDLWTCQAILRSLPPRGKQYILKMLMLDKPIAVTTVKEWTSQTTTQSHRETLKKLVDLKILQVFKSKQQNQPEHLQLNPVFQENIKKSLIDMKHSVLNLANNTNSKDVTRAPTIEELDQYSKTQWEKVLYFLSSDDDGGSSPSPLISELLLSSNLTKQNGENLSITSEGFKFLLKDVYTQIWTLLIVYLNTIHSRGNKTRKDLLSFLFKLSFLTLGKGYLVSELSELQKSLLLELKQFGLIFMKSDSSQIFYPTRLIISLTTGKTVSLIQDIANDRTQTQKEQGYIILETNYRLYAYTSSSLQISLLSLFVKMLYRLPNLAVGIITRESIRTALIHGITAEQIIDFIKKNAHPNSVQIGSPVPDVVGEQIRIWESERNRVGYTNAVLYNSFPNAEIYNASVKFAKDNNYYVWSNDEKKTLVIIGNANTKPMVEVVQTLLFSEGEGNNLKKTYNVEIKSNLELNYIADANVGVLDGSLITRAPCDVIGLSPSSGTNMFHFPANIIEKGGIPPLGSYTFKYSNYSPNEAHWEVRNLQFVQTSP
eukprot:gene7571-9307_t